MGSSEMAVPSRIGRRRRRRRLLTRAVPLAVIAVLAFGAGIVVATGPGRAERAPRLELRHRVGARRLPAHVLAPRPGVAAADVRAAVRGRVPDGGGNRNAVVGRPVARRQPHRRRDPCPDVVAHAAVRHAARDAAASRSTAAARERRSASRRRCCSPGSVPGSSWRAGPPLAAARDPARQRRHAAGAGPRPDLADPRGRIGDRRRARSDPGRRGHALRAGGYPPNAKVGLDGLERIFQNQLAGTPGGTLLAGNRVLARGKAGRRSHGHDHDQPCDRARGDRRDRPGTTPGSPRWTRAPARCWRSRASRSRRSSRPARR